jgi:hypothetical protein
MKLALNLFVVAILTGTAQVTTAQNSEPMTGITTLFAHVQNESATISLAGDNDRRYREAIVQARISN